MSGQVDPQGQSTPLPEVNENTDFSTFTEEQLEAVWTQANQEAPPASPEVAPAIEPAPADNSEVGQPIQDETLPVEPAPADNSQEKVLEPDDVDYKKSFEALQKSHENLQQAYGRMSNEVGQLRKMVPEKPTQADFDNDSVAATEQLNQHNSMNREIQEKEIQAAQLQKVANNLEFHKQYTPDLHANAEGIRKMLIERENLTPEQASNYMGNIMHMDPAGVYNLNQRYKAELKLRTLEAQIAELKKAPSEAVSRMTKINQQTPVVTGSTGESSDPSIGIISDPTVLAELSDEELRKQFFNAQKTGDK